MSGDLTEIQQLAVLHGLIYGATAILFLYNAFLAMATRDLLYLNYSALSVSVLLFQFLQFSPDPVYSLPGGSVQDTTTSISLLFATGVMGTNFLRNLLLLQKPRAGYYFSLVLIATFLGLISVLWFRPKWHGPWVSWVALIPVLFFVFLSAQQARLGFRPAAAILPGLIIALLAGSLHQWLIHSENNDPRAELVLPLGALGALLFFSIALGLRIRSVRLQALTGRNREDFLKTLLQASPFPVLVLREPCAGPVFWNQAAENQYHVDANWSLLTHILPDDASSLPQEIQQEELDRKLVSIRSHSGRMLETAISVRKIVFHGDPAFLHLHVDRTAELQTRRGLEKEQQALEHAVQELEDSTRTRDDFIAAMSHEIRTPMSGILSAAELLEESYRNEPVQASGVKPGLILSTLQRNAYRLLHLLNDILDYARLGAGKMEPSPHRFRIAEFVQSTVSRLEPIFRQANLVIHYQMSGSGIEVRADSGAIRQILDRLAFSLLSSRRDGNVSVSHEIAAGKMRFRIHVKARSLPGADPELIRRIMFGSSNYRPRNARELSLTLARGLLHMIGGELDLHKLDSKESELEISFPVSVVSEMANRTLDQKLSIRILLFEDNEDNAVLLQRLLKKRGYAVTVATTARSGIEMIKDQSPDLVLMDLHLPDMDGFQAARFLQETYGSECPPVAALSASTLERDKKEAMEAGMVAFLSKPIQKEQFESLIAELFSQN